jgi:hypothetical protein
MNYYSTPYTVCLIKLLDQARNILCGKAALTDAALPVYRYPRDARGDAKPTPASRKTFPVNDILDSSGGCGMLDPA